MFKNVKSLMSRWPSYADFARDIGLKPSHIEVMKVRDSIPPRYWPDIVVAARKRRIPGINLAVLAALAAHKRRKVV